MGYKYANKRLQLESNLYYMLYKNQLVLTGELNDVGASVRVNVPESYRAGIEQSIAFQMTKKWSLNANATWSLNKIKAFDEVIADYTIDFTKEIIHHQNTDIHFHQTGLALYNVNIHHTRISKLDGPLSLSDHSFWTIQATQKGHCQLITTTISD
ncbi:MAG: TonB-dependent receptor [Saprospiraceae bacterium]|nr:TonB-dependent receptor [Saprospiraceae bacterium]